MYTRRVTTDHEARRRALAAHVMTLQYPQWDAAWLKVEPLAEVAGHAELSSVLRSDGARSPRADEVRRQLVQVFLEDRVMMWTPEDSPYSLFQEGTWHAADRPRMLQEVDTLFSATAAARQARAVELAAERAQAKADGYELHEPPDSVPPRFKDDATLRTWFTADLWTAPDTAWFVFEPPPRTPPLPAVIALDELLIGLLWFER